MVVNCYQILGKYYHRHRRPNEAVEYNIDPEFHLAKRRTVEEARRNKKRGPGSSARLAAVAAAVAAAAAETPLSLPPADTPVSSEDEDDDDEEDVPLATRNRTKQPSVNRILSPELSDLESVKADSPPLAAQAQPPTPLPPLGPEPEPEPEPEPAPAPAPAPAPSVLESAQVAPPHSPTKSPLHSNERLNNGGPAPSVSSQPSPTISSRSKLNRARILFVSACFSYRLHQVLIADRDFVHSLPEPPSGCRIALKRLRLPIPRMISGHYRVRLSQELILPHHQSGVSSAMIAQGRYVIFDIILYWVTTDIYFADTAVHSRT